MIKRIVFFVALIGALPLISTAQVIPASERTALENLYNNTYGPGWANSTNWLTADESTWFGVTVNGGHVTAITLPDNNLEGYLTNTIGQLTELEILDLSSNQLEFTVPASLGSLPLLVTVDLSDNLLVGMTGFSATSITALHVENNNLTFDAVQLNLGVTGYTYSPQAKLPGGTFTFSPGQSGVGFGSTPMLGNYQWFHNSELLPGENSNSIYFYPVGIEDAGTYHVTLTRPAVPGLILQSEPFVVTLKSCLSDAEKDALIALYNATHGEAWFNNTNWLTSAPVEQWYGVYVSDCHVSQLYLHNNNLNGTLPTELSELSGLYSLDVGNNLLHGAIPVEFENLAQLQIINLYGNGLEGSIPPGIGTFPFLSFVDFSQNKLDEIPAFTSTNIYYFNIAQNSMSFEDIVVNSSVAGYSYAPQTPALPRQYVSVVPSTPVTLQASDTEGNNTYAWFKNGVPIVGENSSSYVIPSVAFSDGAEYTVEITNSVVTGLTFTEPFVLTVSSGATIPLAERGALISLYHATGGDTWTDNTNWLSANESTWAGVTVSGGHVTALNLPNNNLVGTLPQSLGDLAFLQALDLFNNGLAGAVPAGLASITSLTQIQLSANQFTSIPAFTNPSITSLGVANNLLDFDDLLPNASVSGFFYVTQFPHVLSFRYPVYYEGNPVTFRGISYSGAGYQYQWTLESVPIGSANAPSYAINAVVLSDQGNYTLEVTHPSLPGLTITAFEDYVTIDPYFSCIPPSEYAALVELYQSMGGLTWIQSLNWLNGDPASWDGVITDGCHVTELNLPGNKLTGTLSPAIGDLPFLKRLNLRGNQLLGVLPVELGNLTDLEYLDLSYNSFSGNLPAAIGSLAALQTVKLASNQISSVPVFSGAALVSVDISSNSLDFVDLEPNMSVPGLVYLPQSLTTPFSNQTVTVGNPTTLFFSPAGTANNYQWYKNNAAISGAVSSNYSIPSFQLTHEGRYTVKVTSALVPGLTLTSEIMLVAGGGCIPSEDRAALLWLYYSTRGHKWYNRGNWLSADESTWHGVTVNGCMIEGLNLAFNNLYGSMPPQLGDLGDLLSLTLSNNSLSGPIPASLGDLSNLTNLTINDSGLTGSIPGELGNLSSLVELSLSYNRLTGTIPSELSNLTSLQTLNLVGNSYWDWDTGLQGSIPAALGNLTNLSILDLGINQLTGSIPPELGNIPAANLLTLGLTFNRLSGTIPAELENAYSLDVAYNYLTGGLPANLGSGPMWNLLASGNQLTIPLPTNIGDWDQLNTLDVSNNDISGSIPASIGDMQNLSSLYLNDNALTGTIPATIGDLTNAVWINMGSNLLSGSIPTSIANLTGLTGLLLFNNQFTGAIPPAFGNLTQLWYLDLSQNQLDGSIPATLGNLSNLVSLNLNGNELTGGIPPELGNIPTLQEFAVSNNQLTGSIPSTLGNITALRRLYLEHNQLTGPIPNELGSLPQLNWFNAANNQLTGDVPAGFGSIPSLGVFAVQNNQITSVPALSGPITILKVEGNLLDFGDLELNVGKAGYTYSPQNTVLAGGTVSPNLGCTLTIPFATPGAQNTYQWSVAGVDIAGAVSAQYSKLNVTAADNGVYATAVSNTLLPGLTLNSADWTVTSGGTQLGSPSVTDGSGCEGTGITLTASGALGAEVYRWFDVPSGGSSLVTTATYLTPALTDTTEYYVQRFDPLAVCESIRVPVTAFTVAPVVAGATGAAICGPGVVALNASGGNAGEYRWYTVPSGGTAIATETNAAYTTPSIIASASYYVSVDKAGCEGARTTVAATVNPIPSAPPTTGNTSCTSPATVSLTAAGATPGQYRWYIDAVTSTPLSGEVNATFVTPSISTTTTYYVAINDGLCESTRNSVDAVISNLSAPGGTGGSSCNPAALTLTATGGAPGAYRWYTVATGGTAIGGETNASLVTPVLSSSASYFVAIAGATCESPRTQLTATIGSIPPPTVTPQNFCSPGFAVLTASGGTNGEYRWYTVPTGGTPITGEVNESYTTPVLSTTTNYFVALNNGTCESPRLSVNAIAHGTSSPTTTAGSGCAGTTVVLTAGGGTNGQYRWYTTAVGGTPLPGAVNSSFITPSLAATTTYYVSIDDGICESSREPVIAMIVTAAAPSITSGSNCGPGTVSLTASGGTPGNYRWYTVATGGTAISGQTNDTFTTPVLTATTSYFVSIASASCESGRAEVVASIQPVPAAPTAVGGFNCGPGPVTLSASGAANGNYRWYTNGGTLIPGEVNSLYTTSALTSTTTFLVTAVTGLCEGPGATAIAEIRTCAQAPEIASSESTTNVEGIVTVDLGSLITDADGDVDLTTLTILRQPVSGAVGTITGSSELEVDYSGIAFSGLDSLQVQVCDFSGLCSSQYIYIEVIGNIAVYNAVSPNGDNKNDVFLIQYIDYLPGTRRNHVSILNRWGSVVWEGTNYDNKNVVFEGLNKNGNELPSGTYYYQVKFEDNTPPVSGFISLKR